MQIPWLLNKSPIVACPTTMKETQPQVDKNLEEKQPPTHPKTERTIHTKCCINLKELMTHVQGCKQKTDTHRHMHGHRTHQYTGTRAAGSKIPTLTQASPLFTSNSDHQQESFREITTITSQEKSDQKYKCKGHSFTSNSHQQHWCPHPPLTSN